MPGNSSRAVLATPDLIRGPAAFCHGREEEAAFRGKSGMTDEGLASC